MLDLTASTDTSSSSHTRSGAENSRGPSKLDGSVGEAREKVGMRARSPCPALEDVWASRHCHKLCDQNSSRLCLSQARPQKASDACS